MRTTGVSAVVLAATLSVLPACSGNNSTIPVEVVAYRPDGSLVLFTVAGIYIYDGRLVTEMNHIPLDALGSPPLDRGTYGGLRYSLSADGTTAAVSFSSGEPVANARVAIYRIPDGELLSTFEATDSASPQLGDGVLDLALSPDGQRLGAFTNSSGFSMTMFESATGAPLWTDQTWRYRPLVWSPDGTTVFAKGGHVGGADYTLDALEAGTGTLKWTKILSGSDLIGLAVVGDGALLATAAYELNVPRRELTDYPPTFQFRSAADGAPATELPAVPQTWLSGESVLACNATDTCAAGLRDYSRAEQPEYALVYKPDGTVLQTVPTQGDSPSFAISPDGNFITIAAEAGENGGATVFRVKDGLPIGSRIFDADAF